MRESYIASLVPSSWCAGHGIELRRSLGFHDLWRRPCLMGEVLINHFNNINNKDSNNDNNDDSSNTCLVRGLGVHLDDLLDSSYPFLLVFAHFSPPINPCTLFCLYLC